MSVRRTSGSAARQRSRTWDTRRVAGRQSGPVVDATDVALAPLVLIKAGEEFLAERCVDHLVGLARDQDPDVEVHRMEASSYRAGELPVLVSPSLFGERRLLVIRGLEAMNDDFLQDALLIVEEPLGDVIVILVHRGGNRGKKLLDTVTKAGAQVVTFEAVKKVTDKVALLKSDAKRAKRKVTDDAIHALVDGLGDDVREMCAALSQLMADHSGVIDADVVRVYYAGRVEATGFSVADAAVDGQSGKALALLRHARATGTDDVAIVAALAMKFRQLARVMAMRGRPDIPSKMAPWQVRNAERSLSQWSADGLATAITAIAEADANVKGFKGIARDPQYALEKCVLTVCRARGRQRHF